MYSGTQLNTNNGNMDSAYLAMLANVRLDSPTNSLESPDSISQGGYNKPHCFRAANLLRKGKNLAPRSGKVGKVKGKSPLGRR